MKRLTDTLSPLSWAIFCPLGYITAFILFRPTFWEFLILILADTLALLVGISIEKKVFAYFEPNTKSFFPQTNVEQIKRNSLKENIELFESMISYPVRYARFLLFISVPKAIPAFCVVVFYWEHSDSDLIQFLKIFAIGLMCWSYFYGAAFVESHMFLSKEIQKLHRLFDWSRVFEQIGRKPKSFLPSRKDFEFHENIAIISIWVFVLSLQWIILMTGNLANPNSIGLECTMVGITGLALISRIWYLSRQYLLGGLQSIFELFDKFEPPKLPMQMLALHSSPILANFETTVNSLLQRLRSYEQELSHWVVRKAEQSRYQTLGEISGLIVHDLGAPLHVVNFCSQQLKEKPDRIFDSRYLDQLTSNAERSWELINSLRAYLRDSSKSSIGTRFGETHLQVIRLLETRFRAQRFDKSKFHLDSALSDIMVKLSKADLIHILYNLYANSVENLTTHRVSNPEIRITLQKHFEGKKAVILVRDNGTGLTSKQFEHLTAFAYQKADTDNLSSHGLGLKLIRRLAERHGGALAVIDLPMGERGTLFSLTLKVWEVPKDEGENKHELWKHSVDPGRRSGMPIRLRRDPGPPI